MTYRKHLIKSGTPIKEALVALNGLAKDAILFVVDDKDHLIGSLTDGDVRRGLLEGITIQDPVDAIIQSKPKFIRKGDRDIHKLIELREGNFRIIPVLAKNNDAVVNVINFRTFRSYLPIDVVIMAGGKGTRLRPMTESTPKPLLHVGDKPIMEHNIDRLSLYGMDDFWISVNYLGDQIINYFGDGTSRNVSINYVKEEKPLGTIGAVGQIQNFEHDYILITNSDLLTNLDYEAFFLDFIEQNADMGIVTIPYKVDIPYAVLETEGRQVKSFKEKPTYTYYSNGGIYLVKRELLESIPKGEHFNATDLIDRLMDQNKKVVSFPLMGYWLDIGKHSDFEKAQIDINSIKF